MSNSWCLIESDPAVFTELIQKAGVKNIAVEEVLALEPEAFAPYERVYGLIFLFKYNRRSAALSSSAAVVPDAPLYFARQVVDNACATMALVNTLLNYPDTIDLGDNMSLLLNFTQEMDPELRGTQVGEFEPLRAAHNAFAPPSSFANEGPAPQDADAYHFVSFIFRHGAIWELDGLRRGPVRHEAATEQDYKAKLVDVVQRRIAEVSAVDTTGQGQGISFALMALVDDPIPTLEKRIAEAQAQQQPVAALQDELAALKEMRAEGEKENVRRRHNYNPMIVELLKALAEKDKLQAILEEVENKAAAAAA